MGDNRSIQDAQAYDQGGAGEPASSVNMSAETGTDLKALMAAMKAMDAESGRMVDNLCEMNIDLAQKLFDVATLVDPESVSLLYNDVLNHPECKKYDGMSMEEVDQIFEELCKSFGEMAPQGNGGNEG